MSCNFQLFSIKKTKFNRLSQDLIAVLMRGFRNFVKKLEKTKSGNMIYQSAIEKFQAEMDCLKS